MSVVDTRLLGRGAEAEWPDWAMSVRAYGAAIDGAFPVAMEAASRSSAAVSIMNLNKAEQNVARQLFLHARHDDERDLHLPLFGKQRSVVVVRMGSKLGDSWYDVTSQKLRHRRWVYYSRS